jgi:hypothetical protein
LTKSKLVESEGWCETGGDYEERSAVVCNSMNDLRLLPRGQFSPPDTLNVRWKKNTYINKLNYLLYIIMVLSNSYELW